MGPDLIGKLAEHGTLGVLLGIAFWVILKLYQANERAHAKAEEVAASHLEKATRMVEACTIAITQQTSVTEGHKASIAELHETMKEYVDEARRSRGR
jgi:hypothetical protein